MPAAREKRSSVTPSFQEGGGIERKKNGHAKRPINGEGKNEF